MNEVNQLRKLMEAVDADTEKRRADIAKWTQDAMRKHTADKLNGSSSAPYDESPTDADWDEFIKRKSGNLEEINEDWGSSDWYSVIRSMDEYIDKHGLSPSVIEDAAREAALFWGGMMGHDMSTRDGEQEAIDDCIGGWMRMSERGQKLRRMFAPKESVNEAWLDSKYEVTVDSDYQGNLYVNMFADDKEVAAMPYEVWASLVKNVNAAIKGRDGK